MILRISSPRHSTIGRYATPLSLPPIHLRVVSYGVVSLIGLTTLPVLFARWMAINQARGLAIFLITASFYWAPPLLPQKRWHPSLWLWLLGCLAVAVIFGWVAK